MRKADVANRGFIATSQRCRAPHMESKQSNPLIKSTEKNKSNKSLINAKHYYDGQKKICHDVKMFAKIVGAMYKVCKSSAVT